MSGRMSRSPKDLNLAKPSRLTVKAPDQASKGFRSSRRPGALLGVVAVANRHKASALVSFGEGVAGGEGHSRTVTSVNVDPPRPPTVSTSWGGCRTRLRNFGVFGRSASRKSPTSALRGRGSPRGPKPSDTWRGGGGGARQWSSGPPKVTVGRPRISSALHGDRGGWREEEVRLAGTNLKMCRMADV